MMIPEVRCTRCGKKLGERFDGHFEIVCPRCKTFNVFDTTKPLDKKTEGAILKVA